MSKDGPKTLPMRSPRPWHGMTPGIWFPLLWTNRFAISPTRIPMAIAISIITWLDLLLAWMSEAIYGRQRGERRSRIRRCSC